MRVLLSTTDTQGDAADDYFWSTPGESSRTTFVCRLPSRCGCDRAWADLDHAERAPPASWPRSTSPARSSTPRSVAPRRRWLGAVARTDDVRSWVDQIADEILGTAALYNPAPCSASWLASDSEDCRYPPASSSSDDGPRRKVAIDRVRPRDRRPAASLSVAPVVDLGDRGADRLRFWVRFPSPRDDPPSGGRSRPTSRHRPAAWSVLGRTGHVVEVRLHRVERRLDAGLARRQQRGLRQRRQRLLEAGASIADRLLGRGGGRAARGGGRVEVPAEAVGFELDEHPVMATARSRPREEVGSHGDGSSLSRSRDRSPTVGWVGSNHRPSDSQSPALTH